MSDQADNQVERKALLATYKRSRPEAGVYRILNARNGRCLLDSSNNLASVRAQLAFAKTLGSPGMRYRPLHDDMRQFGLDAFALEVLELLKVTPTMTEAQIRDDLAALAALWREKFDPALLY